MLNTHREVKKKRAKSQLGSYCLVGKIEAKPRYRKSGDRSGDSTVQGWTKAAT